MYKILIVDDDQEILKLMKTALEMRNYEVVTRQEVSLPLNIDDFQGFDLILLDIMMSNIEGTEICKRIRREVSIPIIFVSAKDTEEDIVNGLGIGGDDYITKPFSLKQMVAKVEANIKREERNKQAVQDFSEVRRDLGTITFYLEERRVCVNGQTIPLTSREYDILELLSRRTSKVYTREDIYDEVYDEYADALFRSISEYIYQIRNKFAPYNIDPIKTVRGLGYKWHD
ncbi:response regulator transcription factor [Lactococcus lactis]|uniref:response regulator transcription factor n=1 Tax=Lactococcus lactis TaxID=1358 RepID=UPI0011115501|nr:response regulator transcription factor [Lactococcus lactis]